MKSAMLALVLATSSPTSEAACKYMEGTKINAKEYCKSTSDDLGMVVQDKNGMSNQHAPSDGVYIKDGSPTVFAMEAGKKFSPSSAGTFMPGCSLLAKDAAAPSAGTYYKSMGQKPVVLAEGDKAPGGGGYNVKFDNGIFCPSAAEASDECKNVAAGADVPSAGVWVPESTATDVKKGDSGVLFGFFCAGCSIKMDGDKADMAGRLWSSANSGNKPVKVGDTLTAGMFCPTPATTKAKTTAAAGATDKASAPAPSPGDNSTNASAPSPPPATTKAKASADGAVQSTWRAAACLAVLAPALVL